MRLFTPNLSGCFEKLKQDVDTRHLTDQPPAPSKCRSCCLPFQEPFWPFLLYSCHHRWLLVEAPLPGTQSKHPRRSGDTCCPCGGAPSYRKHFLGGGARAAFCPRAAHPSLITGSAAPISTAQQASYPPGLCSPGQQASIHSSPSTAAAAP